MKKNLLSYNAKQQICNKNTIWLQIYESLQKLSDRTNVIQKDRKVTLNLKKMKSFHFNSFIILSFPSLSAQN